MYDPGVSSPRGGAGCFHPRARADLGSHDAAALGARSIRGSGAALSRASRWDVPAHRRSAGSRGSFGAAWRLHTGRPSTRLRFHDRMPLLPRVAARLEALSCGGRGDALASCSGRRRYSERARFHSGLRGRASPHIPDRAISRAQAGLHISVADRSSDDGDRCAGPSCLRSRRSTHRHPGRRLGIGGTADAIKRVGFCCESEGVIACMPGPQGRSS